MPWAQWVRLVQLEVCMHVTCWHLRILTQRVWSRDLYPKSRLEWPKYVRVQSTCTMEYDGWKMKWLSAVLYIIIAALYSVLPLLWHRPCYSVYRYLRVINNIADQLVRAQQINPWADPATPYSAKLLATTRSTEWITLSHQSIVRVQSQDTK